MDTKIGSLDKLIPAKTIITQIENSEVVDYEGITIIGDLDLRELKLPLDDDGHYTIKVPLKITHSEVSGLTKILNVNFRERIDFSGTTFINADFQGSIFGKFVGFEDAIFTGYASFSNVHFIDDVSFTNSQFTENTLVRFDQTIFQKDAFFLGQE